MHKMFDQFDKDANGYLQAEEFKEYMRAHASYREKLYGSQIQLDDKTIIEWYQLENALNPTIDGISKDEICQTEIKVACAMRMSKK